MGDTRRRRPAGTAAHQAELTPMEDFQVPDGRIALTFDIEGADPSTAVIDTAALPGLLVAVGRELTRLPYQKAVRGLVELFLAARRYGDDKALAAVARAGLWLALNHPHSGGLMRERVSDRLRETGSAHITLAVVGERLMLALGPRFADGTRLEGIAGDGWIVAAADRGPAETMH